MNLPKLIVAAIVALTFLTLAGTLLSPILFPSGPVLFAGNERTESLFSFHFLAWLITAVLLAYVFPLGYRGGVAWAEGLRFGMLMGVLASLPVVLHTYADSDSSLPGLITVVLWNIITWGVSGALIGAVYKPVLKAGKG